MKDESLQSATDAVKQQEAYITKLLPRLGVRRILTAQVDPSYSGGNPKLILDGEDDSVAAANETFTCIMPFGTGNIRPSGVVVVMEVAPGEFAIVGELGSQSGGKGVDDGYWMVPTNYPTTETTLTGTSHALLRTCPKTLNVNKVIFQVTTGVGAATSRIKLFSADGGTTVLDTGAISVASNGRKTATISPAVKIIAGSDYRIEVTSSDGSVALRATAMSGDGAAFLNEGLNVRTSNGGGGTPTNTAGFPWVNFVEA